MNLFNPESRGTFRNFTSVSASGTNAAVAVTLAAPGAGRMHHVVGALWSYSGTPTNGRLTSTGLRGDEIDMDITAGGPGPMLLPPASGEINTQVTLTLAAGGVGIVGKLSVWYGTF